MRRLLSALLASILIGTLALPGRARPDLRIILNPDLAGIPHREIEALQRRLADAQCYAGPIDGQATAATTDAAGTCPDQAPVLRIETGMHVAPIKRIGVDAGCKLLATGSSDKTVRLWSLPEGRLIRTVRLPIGKDDGGKVYAVALSPDGRTLAAGGSDAVYEKGREVALYVIDLVSGGVRRLGAFEGEIDSLAFSGDGSRIGVGLGSKGVRVLDPKSGRELMVDQNYDAEVYGLAFGPDGSLFAAGLDGFLRRYGPDLNLAGKVLAGKVRVPSGQKPYGIAVDFEGRRVAVGYYDSTAVSILDAGTLKPVATAETTDVGSGNFMNVTWTADGQQLVAGGDARQLFDGQLQYFLRRFDPAGNRVGADVAAASNTIADVKPCGANIVFAGSDPTFGLVGADGPTRTLHGPAQADMRGKLGNALAVSTDATFVRFGLGYGDSRPVLFDLAAGTLTDSAVMPAGLAPARVDGLPVADWNETVAPRINGGPIVLAPSEMSHALAIRADRQAFALGAERSLHAIDAAGKSLWIQPVPGVAWGVDLSADSRVVVAAYSDGTIRWHRWSDGQELLALFVHRETRARVAWTPSGYFMASPGGEDLIGWHVNRGWEQEADFFPASRFRDRFNRPDIVRLVLKTLDEGAAVKQADAAAHRLVESRALIEHLPPLVTILSPADGAVQAAGTAEVRYATRLPSGGTLDRVEAFVDGLKVEARGVARTEPGTPGDGTGTISLPMPAHDATIGLVAYAGGVASDAAVIELKGAATSQPSGADADALKPSLYALLVGVTHYDAKSYDLTYPAADAAGLAEALLAQKGRLYRDVQVEVLTDKDATATGIKQGLTWLRKQTTAHDLAIVFAAGQGTTDAKGKFWFLPSDMDPANIDATAVPQDEISKVLFDVPGRKLLFLDACHAGAALIAGARGLERTDMSAALNDFAQAEGGVVAYAASTGREFSFERAEWGHGAFTKALIEGFGGKADLLGKGTITTATLDAFLEDRVKDLTGGQQHPVMTRPKTVPDFPVAAVR